MNIGFAVADFLTQVVLVVVGVVLVLDPDLLVEQVDFGTTPTRRRLPDRDPGRRWSPTPGIETISNMAEEARDYGKTIPRGIGLVVGRRGRDLRVPARDRAVGDAGRRTARPRSALPKEQGGYADDPVLGVVENMDLGALQGAGRDLRRHPRRDDPVHRHQRRA